MTDESGHDHHDEIRARVRAVQSLLVEKGIVSTDAVDEAIAAYEEEIGPLNGATVVARAWTDPAFKQRLLDDATDAVAEFDFDVGLDHLAVKENTDDTHNVVVCTLCSCYPWSMLGLPPTWYKTPAYRSRVVREPRSVLAEFGTELDDDVTVEVWDSSSEIRYMVLPQRPAGTEDYDEAELRELVTRNAMIGVERIDDAPATDGGRTPVEAVEAIDDDAVAELLGFETELTFLAPWQARTFGVTVALYDGGGGFDWTAFQERLIDAVEAVEAVEGASPGSGGASAALDTSSPEASEKRYYEQWQDALERLLVDAGAVTGHELDARAREFANGDRTAEEFVAGERHH